MYVPAPPPLPPAKPVITVPGNTPAPERGMPTASAPDDTLTTVSVAPAMEPNNNAAGGALGEALLPPAPPVPVPLLDGEGPPTVGTESAVARAVTDAEADAVWDEDAVTVGEAGAVALAVAVAQPVAVARETVAETEGDAVAVPSREGEGDAEGERVGLVDALGEAVAEDREGVGGAVAVGMRVGAGEALPVPVGVSAPANGLSVAAGALPVGEKEAEALAESLSRSERLVVADAVGVPLGKAVPVWLELPVPEGLPDVEDECEGDREGQAVPDGEPLPEPQPVADAEPAPVEERHREGEGEPVTVGRRTVREGVALPMAVRVSVYSWNVEVMVGLVVPSTHAEGEGDAVSARPSPELVGVPLSDGESEMGSVAEPVAEAALLAEGDSEKEGEAHEDGEVRALREREPHADTEELPDDEGVFRELGVPLRERAGLGDAEVLPLGERVARAGGGEGVPLGVEDVEGVGAPTVAVPVGVTTPLEGDSGPLPVTVAEREGEPEALVLVLYVGDPWGERDADVESEKVAVRRGERL